MTSPSTPCHPLYIGQWLRGWWQFARPHTIIGTTLAVFVFYLLASIASGGKHHIPTLLLTYAASLAVNIYIVGVNQLTDVNIDRINKPYLPIAGGLFSWNTGLMAVIVCGTVALSLAALQGLYLFGTIGIVFLIGSAYSLPPLRLKRSPFWAASCITLARAVVGNVGIYLTYTNALTGRASLPTHVLLFIGFMLVFCVVIAWMKDLPDTEGDAANAIGTLALRLGPRATLALCRGVLGTLYGAMVVMAILQLEGVHPVLFAVGHAVLGISMWWRGRGIDTTDSAAITRYYMFIWKLFYSEFFVFLLSCIVASGPLLP